MAKTCGVCEKSIESGLVEKNRDTVKRWCRCSVTGKDHLDSYQCDVPEKPRLCEVLGVDVGERFQVRNSDGYVDGPFFIRDDGGISCPVRDIRALDLLSALVKSINHPEKIERLPRLTPEEVQRCRDFGAKWVSRDKSGGLVCLWAPDQAGDGRSGGRELVAWVQGRFFPAVKPGQWVQVEDEP